MKLQKNNGLFRQISKTKRAELNSQKLEYTKKLNNNKKLLRWDSNLQPFG